MKPENHNLIAAEWSTLYPVCVRRAGDPLAVNGAHGVTRPTVGCLKFDVGCFLMLHRFSLRILWAIFAFCLFFARFSSSAQFFTLGYDASGNLASVTSTNGSPPTIAIQPANQVISQNGTAHFSVGASGPVPLSYQWLSNGVPITGATNDTLAIPGVIVPTNIIQNGGFELPSEALNGEQIFAAGTNLSGWMVDTGQVEVVNDYYWQPDEGYQSLSLNGSIPGSIYQDIPTVSGQNYYLHFALAGYPTAPAIKTNQVWWGSNLLDTVTFPTNGTSLTDMGWTNREYIVTATNATTRLRFTSLMPNSQGPVLDAVSVIPVWPAPAAYSVIVANSSGSVTSSVASILYDTDGNGIPDAWQLEYFGATGQNPDATNADGISNLQAYQDGSNPTNAATLRPGLSFFAIPSGSLLVSPLQVNYTLGQSVQITALPDAGSVFLSWSGSITATNPSINLMMNTNETLIGTFGLSMTNGARYSASLIAGETNIYAFGGNAGDNVILRMGASAFNPQISLYTATGSLLASVANGNGGGRDVELTFRLTNSALYMVVASSFNAGGAGAYALTLAEPPEPFVVSPGDQGGPMTNGALYAGNIAVGDLDMWGFTATNGNNLVVRMGTAGFNPEIRLYGPDGALEGTSANGNGGGIDTELDFRATNSGNFTVVLSSWFYNGTGPYTVKLAQAPGAFVVSPGEQGGPLTNGVRNTGNITVGDLDLWSLTATNGNSIVLRMGCTNYNPNIRLYGPDGTLEGDSANGNNGGNDTELDFKATNSGSFTVVVNSYFYNGTGPYTLTLAQSPGNFVVSPGEGGGPITNGALNFGNIDVGDLDLWSFTATNGSSIVLRMGTTNFNPDIRLYGPNGDLLGTAANGNGGGRDAELDVQATNSGTFNVLVSSYFDTGNGPYVLKLAESPGAFVVSPGDQGGPLTNGAKNFGNITLGDLAMWSFTATNGNNLLLRMGTTNFNPAIRLYGPNGDLLGTGANGNGGGQDAELDIQATNSGSFTAVLSSEFYNGTGPYTFTLAQAPGGFVVTPGDQGGPMFNGALNTGNIYIGDLDMWSFNATNGNNLVLRIGTTNFNPDIRLYGPNGALLGTSINGNGGGRDTELDVQATNSGSFTVVVCSYFDNGNGPYSLKLAQFRGPFVVSPGDAGGPIVNGAENFANLTLGDLDMWSFSASTGDSIVLRMGCTNFNPDIRLYGPNGDLLGTAANGNGGGDDTELDVQATNSGTFTALVSSLFDNGTGTYMVNLAQIPGAYVVSPGDEGGLITSGTSYNGMTILGDLDLWSFTAFKGAGLTLNCQELSGASGYEPYLRLYGPSGALLASAFSGTTATINYTPTNSGTFTLLVSSYNLGSFGTYQLGGTGFSAGLTLQSAMIVGTNLAFTASGGASNVMCVVLATTNVAEPMALWAPIMTNQFNASGSFNATNLLNLKQSQEFFRLSVP
ncbi:MAG: pre-peptidase C-terminal domain-containing protein [Verrucomicrobiota bacterium]|jgi:choice-of-anchor C domain-containing protein